MNPVKIGMDEEEVMLAAWLSCSLGPIAAVAV